MVQPEHVFDNIFYDKVLTSFRSRIFIEAGQLRCAIDQTAESIVQQSAEYKQLEEYSVQGETRDGAPRRGVGSSSVPVSSYLIAIS